VSVAQRAGRRHAAGVTAVDGLAPAVERVRAALLGPAVPAVIAGLAFAAFTVDGLAGYLTYHSGAYDLGFFDQVVERTAQGHPFQTSLLDYTFLGQHWEPVLAVWAPLDWIAASPTWLVIVNSAALAAAPIFGWRLARAWLGAGWAAPVAAIACALDPLVDGGAAFAYHSEALTPVLALVALDGAARGHRWRFLLPALCLGMVKEDALLVAAGVAWIAWCVERRSDALLLLAGSFAAFAAIAGVVMPALRGGQPGDLASRYSYLGGDTPVAMLGGALAHPLRVLGRLAAASALRGWASAFAPLALLPALARWAALALAPVLLVAILSASPWQNQLLLHYGLESFPLLLACALLGWRRVRAWRPSLELPLAGAVTTSLAASYLLASPLPGGLTADLSSFSGLERRAAIESVLARIPAGAAVSASSGLVPHLSARSEVYEFPDRAFAEPYVVLDDDGPHATWTLDEWTRDEAALAGHGYRTVASAEGVTLWAR
jgi:uncharacterized membrane protein